MKTILILPDFVYENIYSHLIPIEQIVEEAAFIFATVKESTDEIIFEYKDLYLLKPSDFFIQSAYHIELADHIRGSIIKKAHDLNATVIELHSHVGQRIAKFSPTDFNGLSDFVPHVIWRLMGKPYLALVFAKSSFDGLAWQKGKIKPIELDYIQLSKKTLKPTKQSLKYFDYE